MDGLERGGCAASLGRDVPPVAHLGPGKAAERRRQSGRVAGSFAVRVGDPAAGVATATSVSAGEISEYEPTTAAAEAAAVLGELEPAPGPPQVPPPTVEDDASGESGAEGSTGAPSGAWATCVSMTAEAGDVPAAS